MNLLKKSFILFWKNRRLWMLILGYTAISLSVIVRKAGLSLGTELNLLEPTRQILFLCPQIMILYLIVGYEFFSEPYRSHLDEAILSTSKGQKGRGQTANFILMGLMLFANYIFILLVDLKMTGNSFAEHEIEDAEHMAVRYIATCLFVNIYLIGLIGILIGAAIARIRKRIAAYGIIMAVVLCVSYLLNEIADLIMIMTEYAVNLYDILDFINIMTPGLNFITNTALGFPMMTYRICLICFWIMLLLFWFILQQEKRLSMKSGICFLLCILFLVGYALPSSRIDMGLNSNGTAMVDQHYYGLKNYRVQEKENDFCVKKYTMELDVRRLLKAKVRIETSECLESYHFTLSHSYLIEGVYDENGNMMEYMRDGDTLLIYNGRNKSNVFTVVYSGSNEAYYANSQGINLRGSFPYYPIPGYHQISFDGIQICQLFLEKEADFDVTIKSGKKIFSDLEQRNDGHFVGKSEGATFLSGLYTETTIDGIRIVYPLFIGWSNTDLKHVAAGAIQDGYENYQIFITPNVNRQDDAVGSKQIITRNYFTSVKEDLYICAGE